MPRIAIAGSTGRMSRMLIEAVLRSPDCTLTGVSAAPGSAAVGQDAGAFAGLASGVVVSADARQAFRDADVLIDFTQPEASLAHLALCRELGLRAVIGTTGFSAEQQAAIAAHAQHLAVVLSANMSVGVNVMLKLLAQAARALGDGYDIEVIEAHHRHKVDAPSGTALMMGQALAEARGVSLDDAGVFTRHGHTGARRPGSIGFASVRGGDIVGEHLVLFCGSGERVEIAHKSSSRANYADGSLRAARFLMQREAGLYDMADVLDLR